MTNIDEIFHKTIKKAKSKSKPFSGEKSDAKEANIVFNAEEKYPLYTVRIPRDLAKKVEIHAGDKLLFETEKMPDGTISLKAKLKRGDKNV